jgi:hypothetical protein
VPEHPLDRFDVAACKHCQARGGVSQVMRGQPDECRIEVLGPTDGHFEPAVAVGRLLEVVDSVAEEKSVLALVLARASELEREKVRERYDPSRVVLRGANDDLPVDARRVLRRSRGMRTSKDLADAIGGGMTVSIIVFVTFDAIISPLWTYQPRSRLLRRLPRLALLSTKYCRRL